MAFLRPPPEVEIPFARARVRSNRAFISGHGGLPQPAAVMNPRARLIIDLYGINNRSHARTAHRRRHRSPRPAVVISAEVEITPPKP